MIIAVLVETKRGDAHTDTHSDDDVVAFRCVEIPISEGERDPDGRCRIQSVFFFLFNHREL